MTILSIDTVNYQQDRTVHVLAVIDGVVLTHQQTLYDPPEYSPALCEALFSLDEDEYLPDNENEMIQFLDSLDLDWQLVDNSDYYLD
jgi:hypothetical protein